MAEEYEKYKRFEYRMNSNLVLQREGPIPNFNEPTGESESLVGKLKHKMGDKVEYTKPTSQGRRTDEGYRRSNKRKEFIFDESRKKVKRGSSTSVKDRSVLNINLQDIFMYKPSTKYTEKIFSNVMGMVRGIIGDHTGDIINSACNEVLHILKNDKLSNEEKKKQVEDALEVSSMTDEQFIELNNYAREIYDFNREEVFEEVDEEEGVAVVFEEDDEYLDYRSSTKGRDGSRSQEDMATTNELTDDEDDDDDDNDEEDDGSDDDNDDDDADRHDSDNDGDDDQDDQSVEENNLGEEDDGNDDEEGEGETRKKNTKLEKKSSGGKSSKGGMIMRTGSIPMKKKTEKQEKHLSLKGIKKDRDGKRKEGEDYDLETNSIDAHWLQRELNKVFSDPSLCLEKEKEVLDVLGIYDIQECENKLVHILKYENFCMAKLLIKNRWKVYYCTLLGQAQTEKEKKGIMEEMRKSEEGEEILEELSNFKAMKRNKQSEFAKTMRREADNLFRKRRYGGEEATEESLRGDRFIREEDDDDDQDDDEEEDEDNGDDSNDEEDDAPAKNAKSGTKQSVQTKKLSVRMGKKKERKDSAGERHDAEDDEDEEEVEQFRAKFVDLEKMEVKQKGTNFFNREVVLPVDSSRVERKEYDEIIISSSRSKNSSLKGSMDNEKSRGKENYFTNPDDIKLVSVSELPEWAQEVFTCVGISKLNAIQSKVHEVALHMYEKNMLICAPTGSGKTNIALLCMLNVIGTYRLRSGNIDKNNFKIIYISPMKALVNEQVQSFSLRLKCLNMKVSELTGDVNLSSKEIEESQVIVMTPEKFEVISRKWNEKILLQKIKLIIFDEIHLLNEIRGNVLESIISRINRYVDNTLVYDGGVAHGVQNEVNGDQQNDLNMRRKKIRLVGLSATLPNYEDVGMFLRADLRSGVFYFDYSFRPVQLEQHYIGIKEKKGIKKYALMNQVTYEKVLEEAGKNQILIFVHSRKETYRTAKMLIEKFLKSDNLNKFLMGKKVSSEILLSEKEAIVNEELKEILPFGFGIHHAGMKRTDRKLVEDLFSDRHLQVLVSTSTLAWGVNLPAHTVIIKGTSVYNISVGDFDELSPMDILQMVGRSGRPQYDKSGKAIIITEHKNLQLYLSLNNEQLSIESTLMKNIVNVINSEIVLKNIQNIKEGVNWFRYTYLYIRMMKNPELYGIFGKNEKMESIYFEQGKENNISDLFMEKLNKKIYNIIYSAFITLEKYDLVKYNKKLNTVSSTYIGRISSYYYVDYRSIDLYSKKLNKHTNETELLKIFGMSDEFKHIFVREEEKLELSVIMEKLPIPLKESISIPHTKINILLQLYLSNVTLNGYVINADLIYIQQNALRIFRAFFEISLKKNSYHLSALTLKFCKMVERKMWGTMSPLRQFGLLSNELIRIIEKKNITFRNYLNMSLNEYITIFKNKKIAKNVYKLVHHFPKIELNAYIQPINHRMLKVELNVTPDFIYNPKYHGNFMLFWVFVFDISSESMLHYDLFSLKRGGVANSANINAFNETSQLYKEGEQSGDTLDDHLLTFFVPINENPFYIVKVVSDKWLECESTINLYLKDIILPSKVSFSTPLLDLQALPVNTLKFEEAKKFFHSRNITHFNPIHTQIFPSVYEMGGNVIICSSPGRYYLTPAEFAILKMIRSVMELNSFIRRYIKKEDDLYKIIRDRNIAHIAYNNPMEFIKIVYVAPLEEVVSKTYDNWTSFATSFGMKMAILTGDVQVDTKILQKNNIILCTPDRYNNLSKKWRRKKIFQSINLYVFDHMELLDLSEGSMMEVVISRVRYIATQLELGKSQRGRKSNTNTASSSSEGKLKLPPFVELNLGDDRIREKGGGTGDASHNLNKMQHLSMDDIYENIGVNRIVCLSSCSINNCKDIGEWIGCKKSDYYNFLSSVRNVPIEIYLHAVSIMNKQNRYLSMQRQVYQTVRKLKKKNAIIFVTEDKMCKTLALDLVLSACNDGCSFFSNLGGSTGKENLEDHLQDRLLVELLKQGVGYLYRNMNEMERKVVEALFDKKAIQLLIVAHDYVYRLNVYGNVVILLDTIITHFDGKEEDYSIQSVLQMLSYAGREGEDTKSFVYIYTYITKKEYYKNFIYEPLTVESNMEDNLPNFLNNEIVMNTIENYQDAIDWITWSFFYRRIRKNPNYYGLKGVSNEHISDYLSELIESNIELLSFANCVLVEEGEDSKQGKKARNEITHSGEGAISGSVSIKPCNLGIIASYYNIDYHVIHFFNQYVLSLKGLKKNRILEIVCLSSVMSEVVKMSNYDVMLCVKIAQTCNMKVTSEFLKLSISTESITGKNSLLSGDDPDGQSNHLNKSGENDKKEQYINLVNFISNPMYFTPHLKALIILQAHIHRYSIPINYVEETKRVLQKTFKLINALIDVISSNNILNFCLFVMEISQMLTQSMNRTDESNLMQLPHFDEDLIKKAKELEIGDVYDLINAEDEQREELLNGLSEKEKSEIANVCNIFPVIEVHYDIDLEKKYKVNEIATLNLTVERDLVQDDPDATANCFAHSLYLPFEKEELWWVVIGIKKMNLLLSIKKQSLVKAVNNLKVNFELPDQPGRYDVVIYIINDCYVGCDQEYEFSIDVEA
ncbi:pre-mRNA-splicing helicase BRR2, putative [Plasmodium knowlesi strain H]|uniref:U5 small nuclear ribonucleoprotein 200 kDa helicase n=3 Tax=Plasmodium knowlesi TaxID=5850 RepID=A0A5K1UB39_PLAKH|nr:pre-mRNA-splicing helicase BRR2, putative [Plasmodium knowlesi strain H]OTN68107.1 putative Pre-mRNA-splicing helicase BRR2 [Plasmodium knowlesi]CAA9987030.1 pre-mRNA-splicing helicase BRR2, putative [Plasmodium knowlesi strain H]SBO26705.1 pre-mRNA-splicing helicase BRR2, putative [Plasmodium knowlesi strain H]SBO28235.1 pre-mRNA-splicing helicase BRR2, putative [Plasmodium knowlesi strain H]VVS76504.1 pre-mRNA-splicing helicase BRR2, putative [Plasmodium knowlesi strain H]|eukprot:XP_002258275.1 u5 small nuclear ribonucleoprotein-specific protein, putative [Plasmodium knowlesi strain H]